MSLKNVLGTQGGRTAGKEGKKKESGRVERGAWRWQRFDPSQAAVG